MIDQLYSDFTTNLLPKIQEGLVITKDYFIDLFGRYVQYLIITDIIMIVLWLLCIIVPLVCAYVFRKAIIEHTEGGAFMLLILIPFPITFLILATDDLIKAIYIPEVRIMEEIQYMRQ